MASSYQLLDSGDFLKLEQVGPFRLVRPSAQAVWKPRLGRKDWSNYDAAFKRESENRGSWERKNSKLPAEWICTWGSVPLNIRLTDFGHIGIFPEHHAIDLHRHMEGQQEFRLLNLFAYTGALSIQAAALGAEVVHVDASKVSVEWAKKNAALTTGRDLRIRWIVDDVRKFVAREKRRGAMYHGIVLDPPSFGRGAKAEVWKIEDHLVPLLEDLRAVMAESFCFFKLSAHSPGYTPTALGNLTADLFPGKVLECFEMLIPEHNSPRQLPSGAGCVYLKSTEKQ